MSAFSVLTFNTFAGSPHSFIPGTKAMPSLGSSSRLPLQLEAIARMAPDIVCVQEAYCDYTADCYTRLSSRYEFCMYKRHPTLCGIIGKACIVFTLAGALCCFIDFAVMFVTSYFGKPDVFESVWYGIAMISLSVSTSWYKCRMSALAAWMSGQVAGGVMVLFNRERFELMETKSQLFQEQRGDWLNLFRPRGYNQLILKDTHLATEVLVTNVHLNLGGDVFRQEQVREVLESALAHSFAGNIHICCGDFNAHPQLRSASMATQEFGFIDTWAEHALPTETGDTWCHKNELTHVMFDVEDERVDYIFYKSSNIVCDSAALVFDEPPYMSDHFGLLATFVQRIKL
jgi:endonuclease/exonuclease/phosphatase family metal-dependent hydrolase